MKLKIPKNLTAKIVSLVLAIALWFLIKHHINTGGGDSGMRNAPIQKTFPKAVPVPE